MDTGIKVGDCMKTELITIMDDASVFDAARKMTGERVGTLVVSDARKRLYGIVTDEDLVRKVLATNNLKARVKDVVSKPLIGVAADADLSEAAKLMGQKHIKRLVIQKGRDIVGIVTARDIIELSPSLYDLIAEREHLKLKTL